ncbi:MAG: hypothetical protein ACE5IB_01270 [Candidatus Geothermarchaeales archaeon]
MVTSKVKVAALVGAGVAGIVILSSLYLGPWLVQVLEPSDVTVEITGWNLRPDVTIHDPDGKIYFLLVLDLDLETGGTGRIRWESILVEIGGTSYTSDVVAVLEAGESYSSSRFELDPPYMTLPLTDENTRPLSQDILEEEPPIPDGESGTVTLFLAGGRKVSSALTYHRHSFSLSFPSQITVSRNSAFEFSVGVHLFATRVGKVFVSFRSLPLGLSVSASGGEETPFGITLDASPNLSSYDFVVEASDDVPPGVYTIEVTAFSSDRPQKNFHQGYEISVVVQG